MESWTTPSSKGVSPEETASKLKDPTLLCYLCELPNEGLPWRGKKNNNAVFNWGGMFRHFPGSLIQSGLDLKALNRNKPGRHRSRLDPATAFLMLVFQGAFVFPLHDFPCSCGITGTGFGYLVNWGVCIRVCKGGREKAMCWRVLKFSHIALYSEWENGTLMQMKTFLEGGSQS